MKKKVTDYELDPQIKNAIELNARRGWSEYNDQIEAEQDKQKRKQKKERILTGFVIAFILTITCLLLIANSKLTNPNIDKCIAKGHSDNYCYEKLA